ncbi:MAG: 2Fe-2S iron-sulfur cluster-binding protein [Spirochaetaceae bacterium]
MARIIVVGKENRTVETSPAVSILNSLLRKGVRISHLCGGKALCGTCRVQILDGRKYLSPMGEAERVRLTERGPLPEDVRLACQTYTWGTVTLRVLAPGKVPPGKRVAGQ